MRFCLGSAGRQCPQNLLNSEDLPSTSLTILRGCGELVRTCGELPMGGVLSGVRWPPLSPEPPPFRGLNLSNTPADIVYKDVP